MFMHLSAQQSSCSIYEASARFGVAVEKALPLSKIYAYNYVSCYYLNRSVQLLTVEAAWYIYIYIAEIVEN